VQARCIPKGGEIVEAEQPIPTKRHQWGVLSPSGQVQPQPNGRATVGANSVQPWGTVIVGASGPRASEVHGSLSYLCCVLAASLCESSDLDGNQQAETQRAHPGLGVQSIPLWMTIESNVRGQNPSPWESKGEDPTVCGPNPMGWTQAPLAPPPPGMGVWRNLVDPASSRMLRSRAKPCTSQRKWCNSGSVNGSLHQQSSP
jgi:hypothetical protein